MEDRLIKALKSLKATKPEEGFVHRSRTLIMASEQKPARFGFSISESFKLGIALALASILLFVAFGGLSYLHLKNPSSPLFTILNDQKLKEEAQKLDFQIQLGQAKYDLGKDTDVGSLDQILKNLSL